MLLYLLVFVILFIFIVLKNLCWKKKYNVMFPISGIPPTRGHWELLVNFINQFGTENINKIYIGIFQNKSKSTINKLMTASDYQQCLNYSTILLALPDEIKSKIYLIISDNTVISTCRQYHIDIILRGYRSTKDYFYEIKLWLLYVCEMVYRLYPVRFKLMKGTSKISSSSLRNELMYDDADLNYLSKKYDVPQFVLGALISARPRSLKRLHLC